MSIYEKIKSLCEMNGTTITALESELGFGRGSLSKLKEHDNIQIDRLRKVADHFGVSAANIIDPNYIISYKQYDIKQFENVLSEYSNLLKRKRVPVLGKVAAGIPIEEITDILDWEDVSRDEKGELFGLKVQGNSMAPRIQEGDVLIVRQQPTAETGDVAIVQINGDSATCKKIVKHSDGISLISFNPAYEPMTFNNKEIENLPVRILGIVIENRQKFKKL